MKTIAAIGGLFREDIGDKLFDELLSIYPEGATGSRNHAFSCMLPLDSEEVTTILMRLEAAGLRPHRRGAPRIEGEEYTYVLHRRYGYEDLRTFRFVECMPLDTLSNPRANDAGALIVDARDLRPHKHIVRSFMVTYRMLVRDHVKVALESASLSNVQFGPVDIRPQPASGREWWELLSDVVMPPLSPLLKIYGRGVPLARGQSEFVWGFREEPYAHPELRYLKSDIDTLEPFDLALTLEGKQETKRMVASHRFYEACIASGVETNWLPVHIDEG